MRTTTTTRFEPAARLEGEIRPPADKSISHRAAILGAMAQTPVKVTNYLAAADTHSTLDAVRALGAATATKPDGTLTITGVGLRGARAPGRPIDVGNAGTLMRLLPGWLAAMEGRAFTLDGDDSIRRRPVDRIGAAPVPPPSGRPHRGAPGRMGCPVGGARRPPAAVHGHRRAAPRHPLRAAR